MEPKHGDIRFDSAAGGYQIWLGDDWYPHPPPALTNGLVDKNVHEWQRHIPPTGIFEVRTSSGTIKADMNTGIVEFPPGMNRPAALYEFWQGFAQIYRPNHSEIALAKQETQLLRDQVKDAHRTVSKKIAEKIQEKYGNEKFIMIKPDDLIKFLTS